MSRIKSGQRFFKDMHTGLQSSFTTGSAAENKSKTWNVRFICFQVSEKFSLVVIASKEEVEEIFGPRSCSKVGFTSPQLGLYDGKTFLRKYSDKHSADDTSLTELDSKRDLYSCSEDSFTESLARRSLTSACHRSRCIRRRAISSPFSSTLNAKSLIVCSKSAYGKVW